MNLKGEAPRLCLVIEATPDPESLGQVKAALTAVMVASLVVAPATGRALSAPEVKPLIALAQEMGVAALLESDADLALTLGADGVHLPWQQDVISAYRAARTLLGPHAIVGVDVGRSRHDAMSAGELGADYVAFGIPPHVTDRAAAKARRLELIAWWAEIFEPPCVAFDVETAGEGRELTAAGADFIAARIPHRLTPSEVGRWAAEFGPGTKAAAPFAT